jgi:hypothetical protein
LQMRAEAAKLSYQMNKVADNTDGEYADER